MPQARHVQMLIQQSNFEPFRRCEIKAVLGEGPTIGSNPPGHGFPALQHVDASRDAHSGSTLSQRA